VTKEIVVVGKKINDERKTKGKKINGLTEQNNLNSYVLSPLFFVSFISLSFQCLAFCLPFAFKHKIRYTHT
jgi:hypothetical protein